MDYHQLSELFRATLVPQLQQAAEQQLNTYLQAERFIPCLLQVVMAADLDMPVRQSGSIYLKNTLMKFWKEHEGDENRFSISNGDKELMRENMVEAIIHAPDMIRSQLVVCLKHMIKLDFPQSWTSIVDKINVYLGRDERECWLGAFLALHQLVKKYEFKKEEERVVIDQPMRHFLPIMHARCRFLMPDASSLSATVQKLIVKTFFSLVQFTFPLHLFSNENFITWMDLFLTILQRDVPEEVTKMDEDSRAASPWWKCKKWAMQCLCRLFERYGNKMAEKQYKKFSEFYAKTFAVPVMEALLRQIENHRVGAWISPRVLQQAFSYIGKAVGNAPSWNVLKPHIQVLIQEIFFPLMCHSDEDESLWVDDPYEYIRVKYDVYEELVSPVSAAVIVIQQAARKRKNVLKPLMTFCQSVLTQPPVDPRRKDGVLHIIGTVADVLIEKSPYNSQIEGLLQVFVLPEFQSAHGFLRSRACWIAQNFSRVVFTNAELLAKLLDSTRICLTQDKDVPVRVEAAIALQFLLEHQEIGHDYIEPHVTEIVRAILTVIQETENDDLTGALEEMIKLFSIQVTPYATDLTRQLCQTCFQLIDVNNDGNDDDAYKAMTAIGILSTLQTLLVAVQKNPHIMETIEQDCGNLCAVIFQHKVIDVYEEALVILSQLTMNSVSPLAWQLFPLVNQCFFDDGFDYFVDMVPAFHNYVTSDTRGFVSNPANVEAVYGMCTKVLENDDCGEDAQNHACKLLEVVVLQCKEDVSQILPNIIKSVLERVTKAVKTKLCRAMCLQVVVAALYVNPVGVIGVLEKLTMPPTNEPVCSQFFSQWFKQVNCTRGAHNRKMGILGLLSVLRRCDGPLPPYIVACTQEIVPAFLTLFSGLEKAYQAKAGMENDEDDDEVEDDDDDVEIEGEELASDEDDFDEEDAAYVGKLAEMAAKRLDDEETEDDDEDVELDLYDTPIDSDDIDEYDEFKSWILGLQASNPEAYGILTARLAVEQQQALQEVIALCDRRLAAKQSKLLEAQGGYQFTNEMPKSFDFSSVSFTTGPH